MSNYHKEQLLGRVHDPEKVAFINTLNDDELNALAGMYTTASSELIENHPQAELMHAIRVIYYRQVIDWASEKADETQAEIIKFIDSPTFVQYPDFLLEDSFVSAIKNEMMQNHSKTITDLQGSTFSKGPELEILGARLVGDAPNQRVEILMLSNQIKPFPGTNEYMIFEQDRMDIPPKALTGLLKRNPTARTRGRGNEVYISMESPYPGHYGEPQYTEVVIGHFGEDSIIIPIEDV